MPTIYDGIDTPLHQGLSEALAGAARMDVCSGYFHLRGWGMLSSHVDALPGDERRVCRVFIGMQRAPEDQMKVEQGVTPQMGKRTSAEAAGYRAAENERGSRWTITATIDRFEGALAVLIEDSEANRAGPEVDVERPLLPEGGRARAVIELAESLGEEAVRRAIRRPDRPAGRGRTRQAGEEPDTAPQG